MCFVEMAFVSRGDVMLCEMIGSSAKSALLRRC